MATVVRSMALGPNMYIPNGPTLLQQSVPVNPYRKRPIAPAPTNPTPTVGHQSGLSGLKDRPIISKKYCALPYAVTPQQSASIQRRNARERNRVKQVNNGFANLRQHIPSTVVAALTNGGRGPHKKLSKVDTLKVAVKYIRSLQRMLDEDLENNGEKTTTTSSITKSTVDMQALSPVSYYGSMSEPSTASSPAPSQISEYSNYSSSQPETVTFKREPYDVYSSGQTTLPTPTTTVLPSMTSFSTVSYSQPIHHVYKSQVMEYHQPEELSPQNTDDEELLDAISWWQQQQ